MPDSAKLPKSERIGSDSRIDALFSGGRRGFVEPVRFCWLKTEAREGVPPVAVMFSVPKKQFRRAWKRNLIKRRMKESYRQAKAEICGRFAEKGIRADIAFICSANEIPDYNTINNAIRKILAKIMAGI